MERLEELIAEHNITMTPVYTHSVDGASTPMGSERYDYDVYDCFFTIEGEISLYGGRSNARTLLVRDYGQSPANSRPRNGDQLTLPTAVEVLTNVLSNAYGMEGCDDFIEWANEWEKEGGFEAGLHAREKYDRLMEEKKALETFLGTYYYHQFIQAVAE